ncbi:uncharacterized, partial [Tachysurus ichikawai]
DELLIASSRDRKHNLDFISEASYLVFLARLDPSLKFSNFWRGPSGGRMSERMEWMPNRIGEAEDRRISEEEES